MRSAYNETELYNLMVLKDVKNWWKHKMITDEQNTAIKSAYVCKFYHPNFIIRVLLFVAGMFALSGITGFFFLFEGVIGNDGLPIGSVIYGIASFVFLKYVFIDNKHYKSGITEVLLYHAISFTVGGLYFLSNFNMHLVFTFTLLVTAFAAFRYLDLVTTVGATLTLCGLVFFEFYEQDGILRQLIPFALIVTFTILYFIVKRLKKQKDLYLWTSNLIIVESLSLIIVYLAGNYLVVRELSVNLMDMTLEEGENIPFAFIFYGFTILIPVAYLFFGIKNKDVILLRVSVIVIGLSVLTFKYYYGFGHPEITLTLAGAVILLITLSLFNYLKTMRNGFTRENLLSEKWSNANLQAFIVSQTLGGNRAPVDDQFKGGGGEFGGGGASGDF